MIPFFCSLLTFCYSLSHISKEIKLKALNPLRRESPSHTYPQRQLQGSVVLDKGEDPLSLLHHILHVKIFLIAEGSFRGEYT